MPVLFVLVGYLAGSLPFSVWVSRLFCGKDVREGGSHHATATNVLRQSGWPAGLLVLLLDFSKGFLPVFAATRFAGSEWWLPALTGAAVVAGHIWPLFAGFRGGMGLASSGGACLAISPPALAIVIVGAVILLFLIRHAARAMLVAAILAGPALWLFQFPARVLLFVFLISVLVGFRYASDWRREYRELWFDRG